MVGWRDELLVVSFFEPVHEPLFEGTHEVSEVCTTAGQHAVVDANLSTTLSGHLLAGLVPEGAPNVTLFCQRYGNRHC